jgi:hypothetical protein
MKKSLFLVFAILLLPVLSCAADKGNQALPVIGAVETLTLVEEKMRLPARIDTGAETSSLGALGIQPFERDGKGWLRFQVKDPSSGKLVELERPLERKVKIKQHGELASERFVVSFLVSIGNIKQSCEFSLVDRTDYEYPALVGRNFLKGKVMIDISREYITHPLDQGEKNAD